MARLAVAVVKADRNLMSNLVMSPMDGFRLVAAQARSLLQFYDGPKLLIAPEYFLNTRRADDASVPVPVGRGDKHDAYRALKEISAGIGDTIIVAGTIFYARKGNRVGLNVCPVLKNGKIIYKYYKNFDDGGLNRNFADAEFRTKDTGPIFVVDGITFGIDVCGDLVDTDTQQRNWQGRENAGLVQIHIVIADGAGLAMNRIQAGAGGYAILTNLADGGIKVKHSVTGQWRPQRVGDTGVYARSETDVEPQGAASVQATGARIQVYDLEV